MCKHYRVRVRVTYFRVTYACELQTRCKGRAYASGSGGVGMYTPHARHMRVSTRVQLDSGSRWMCKHYRVRVRVTYFRVTRELQTRCKGRAYASGSGGVRMYTSHTRLMCADMSIGRDSGSRRGHEHN
jgi:hypothetical protein